MQKLLKGLWKSKWSFELELEFGPKLLAILIELTELGESHVKTVSSFSVSLEVEIEHSVDVEHFSVLRKIITWAFQLHRSKSQVIIRKRGV